MEKWVSEGSCGEVWIGRFRYRPYNRVANSFLDRASSSECFFVSAILLL